MPCFNFSRAITIVPGFIGGSGFQNVPSNDLSNYQVMFSGTYSWLATVANGGHVQQSNGQDIYFTSDAAGLNILPYERVAYNPTTGAVEFHILLPTLSHTVNTVFYVFYGSAAATDQQAPASVWSDYQAVYHFGDGTTLSLADSSPNHYNGTNVNGVTAGATLTTGGSAGGSAHFSAASSQYINVGSVPNIDNATVTASTGALVVMGIVSQATDSGSSSVSRTVVGKYNTNGWGVQQEPPGQANALALTIDGNSVYAHMNDPTGFASYLFWYVVRPGTNAGYEYAYANGTFQSSSNMATATVAASPGVPLFIGNNTASPYGIGVTNMFWDGNIDELRIRSTNFPNAGFGGGGSVLETWVRVQINNLFYTSSFYTVGTETGSGPNLTVLPTLEPNGVVGSPYTVTFTASGGVAPYTFAVDSGTLPPGLGLDAATGQLAGTPTLAGTYNFVVRAIDSSSPAGCGSVAAQIVISSTPPAPPLPPNTVQTLRFEIPKKRWFPHSYADPVVVHYLDELYLNSVDNQQLLMLSRSNGFIYRSGGDTDNGTAVTSIATTPSMDGGDDRIQKLYVDVLTDADNVGTLNAFALYNNQTINGASVAYTLLGPRTQQLQNISSLSSLNLYRNVAIQYQWTGGPDGPRIYICEPAGYAQPYISTFFITQFINLAFPGWKHHRFLYAGYISNSPILFTIKTQDGRTYGPYTLPSTGGQFKVTPFRLDQNIKDLAFAYQIDGQGLNFVLFPESWTIEVKEWTEPDYIPLAIFKT